MQSPAMQAALAEINQAHDARALRYFIRARTERRKRVTSYMAPECYGSMMCWLSEVSPYVGGFMTTRDARNWLRKEISRLMTMKRLRARITTPSATTRIVSPAFVSRLIVATYFDRFGQYHWQREARAA